MSRTLVEPVHSELLIRKSRFLGTVEPVADRAEAQARVAALRASHPGATHVAWALLAGGHSAAADDGEPGGTAGRPMLEVLRHHDLDGVLATAVRYFGGIKLGVGGLARAYRETVALALRDARYVDRVPEVELACSVPYPLEGWLRRELADSPATALVIDHGPVVTFRFRLPAADEAGLRTRLDDGGRGALAWIEPPGDPTRADASRHRRDAPR